MGTGWGHSVLERGERNQGSSYVTCVRHHVPAWTTGAQSRATQGIKPQVRELRFHGPSGGHGLSRGHGLSASGSRAIRGSRAGRGSRAVRGSRAGSGSPASSRPQPSAGLQSTGRARAFTQLTSFNETDPHKVKEELKKKQKRFLDNHKRSKDNASSSSRGKARSALVYL